MSCWNMRQLFDTGDAYKKNGSAYWVAFMCAQETLEAYVLLCEGSGQFDVELPGISLHCHGMALVNEYAGR